jgi:hypothetical protein
MIRKLSAAMRGGLASSVAARRRRGIEPSRVNVASMEPHLGQKRRLILEKSTIEIDPKIGLSPALLISPPPGRWHANCIRHLVLRPLIGTRSAGSRDTISPRHHAFQPFISLTVFIPHAIPNNLP